MKTSNIKIILSGVLFIMFSGTLFTASASALHSDWLLEKVKTQLKTDLNQEVAVLNKTASKIKIVDVNGNILMKADQDSMKSKKEIRMKQKSTYLFSDTDYDYYLYVPYYENAGRQFFKLEK